MTELSYINRGISQAIENLRKVNLCTRAENNYVYIK